MTKNFVSVRCMALIAVMTAVTCVLGPLSFQIGIVPTSLTNLAIYLSMYILGCKKGSASYVVYLFIGLVGVPVFSGFTGGVGKLFGPTGGYLIGFLFMAWICGVFIDRSHQSVVPSVIGMILGTVMCYAFGTIWLAYQAHMTFYQALAAGVLPFVACDLAKIIVAALVGPRIRRQLVRANLTDAA